MAHWLKKELPGSPTTTQNSECKALCQILIFWKLQKWRIWRFGNFGRHFKRVTSFMEGNVIAIWLKKVSIEIRIPDVGNIYMNKAIGTGKTCHQQNWSLAKLGTNVQQDWTLLNAVWTLNQCIGNTLNLFSRIFLLDPYSYYLALVLSLIYREPETVFVPQMFIP